MSRKPRDPPLQTASRYQGKVSRVYFRTDAGFANPEVYEFLEAERIKYAIRLPANRILQERIGHLLTRPIGRPPNEVRRSYANFTYQAGSWTVNVGKQGDDHDTRSLRRSSEPSATQGG